jgi:hypothetical protein
MTVQARIDAADRLQDVARLEGTLLLAEIEFYELHSTANPGSNETYFVALDGGQEAFHKPFHGVAAGVAVQYKQDPDAVPLNEVAAWLVAKGLGSPVKDIVAPCVLRSHEGESGSLAARALGIARTMEAFRVAQDQCDAAAFFDALIGQQDRHFGNFRWNNNDRKLGLIDHGFAFACPGWTENGFAFIDYRYDHRDPALTAWEAAVLEQLLVSPDLFGAADLLAGEQSQAMADRARRMLADGAIIKRGF